MSKTFHKNSAHNQNYDFALLTKTYPNLNSFIEQINERTTINFGNAKAVKALNTALLFAHYGIKFWQFPESNLCPPIPSRADYIHHLNDLITEKQPIKVLDIGTGATCIYPLLGNSIYHWQFVGTDISKKSLAVAQQIIDKNGLQSEIELRLQPNKNHILQGITNANEPFTFTMCNPPFYTSAKEATAQQQRKIRNLKLGTKLNFSGQANELWYKGGEQQFLHNYIKESAEQPHMSEWFTCLLSKKESVKSFEKLAKQYGATESKTIAMQTRNKATRIAIWRF